MKNLRRSKIVAAIVAGIQVVSFLQWGHHGVHHVIHSFRDLTVWQRAMTLAERVYQATSALPREEAFGLTAQIRRAALSIPSNIAEGKAISGRGYLRHLRIALGSEAELQTQIELAARLGMLNDTEARSLLNDTAEVGRMLSGLLKSLLSRQTPTP